MSQPEHQHLTAHEFAEKEGASGGKTASPPPFQLKTGNPAAAPIQRQTPAGKASSPAAPKRTGGARREARLETKKLGLLSPYDYNYPSKEREANEEALINPQTDWSGNTLPANWEDGIDLQETEYAKNHTSFDVNYGLAGQNFQLKAYFIQGKSDQKAMVVGGIHGSERASVEVAERLLKNLQNSKTKPHYSVLLIPSLMPQNYDREHSHDDRYTEVKKDKQNKGQYIRKGDGASLPKDFKKHKIGKSGRLTDPNRQAPKLGKGADPSSPLDAAGRPMEPEIYMLTALFNRYHPSRIAMLHGHGTKHIAGIFADPQTDPQGIAKGYAADRELAIGIAERTEELYDQSGHGKKGKHEVMPGNANAKTRSTERAAEIKAKNYRDLPNAIYPGKNDPNAVAKGKKQPRTYNGGRSFGSWFSTGVEDKAHPHQDRPSVTTLTLETMRNSRSDEMKGKKAQRRAAQLEATAVSLEEIFLGPDAKPKAPANPKTTPANPKTTPSSP